MKVCLIQPPVPELKDDKLDPPMGLLYLANAAEEAGHEPYIVDLCGVSRKKWRANIGFAHLYGISTHTANYHRALEIKKLALEINPRAQTVAGGPHATALPVAVKKDGFDFVVTGEGETALKRILSGQLSPGVHLGVPVENLDELRFPDFSRVCVEKYTRRFEGKRSFQLFASRGCPYGCAFCTTENKHLRRRSAGNVAEEIQALLDRYGDVSFRFKDDLFAHNVQWLQEFANLCPEIEYSCNIRADCNPHSIEVLCASGCRWACIGVESGSNKILNNMRKGVHKDRAMATIRSLHEMGIRILGWFIVGFPGETWDTVKETVDFINEAQMDKVIVYPLMPYPGTRVWRHRDDYGLRIIDNDFSHYFYIQGDYEAGFVYETDELPRELIREMREYVLENII